MYLCSKFQSKSNEVRCDELSPNTKLQISNNARSKNITLIQYMDIFKAFNILIHHLDIAFKTSQLISVSIYTVIHKYGKDFKHFNLRAKM